MRTSISGRNIFPTFSIEREYLKLQELFCKKKTFLSRGIYSDTLHSYSEVLNHHFLEWYLRGSFTSAEEMINALQINEYHFSKRPTKERLLDYVEFILNAVLFVDTIMASPIRSPQKNFGNLLRDQCNLVLDKLDAEAKAIGLELCVVYKNDVATAVSIQLPELASCIIEYQKIDNRNDLERKGEILGSLAKHLEPHEQRLKDNGYLQLCKDATFLLNKTGARHALDSNDGIEAQFLAMDNSERIKWYDRGFKTVLACMALLPYLDFKNEIKDIKHNG